jgi:hypothetical protein
MAKVIRNTGIINRGSGTVNAKGAKFEQDNTGVVNEGTGTVNVDSDSDKKSTDEKS